MNLYLVKLHYGKPNPNACGADSCIVIAEDGDRAIAQSRQLAKVPTDFDPMFFTPHILVQGAEWYVGYLERHGVLFAGSRFSNHLWPEDMMR